MLVAYDGLSNSRASTLASFTSAVLLIWGGVGVYFVVQYAVVEERSCDAVALRTVSRIYAFFYVASFLWSLLTLLIWVLESFIASRSLALQVLQKAWQVDEQCSPSGFPMVSILVRALLLRSEKDMAKMQASILRGEIMELRTKKAELVKQEGDLDGAISAAQERLQVASGKTKATVSAEELTNLYSRDLAIFLDRVSIFSLAVQTVINKFGAPALDAIEAEKQHLLEEAHTHAALLSEAAQKKAHDLTEAAEAGFDDLRHRASEAGFDEINYQELLHRAAQQADEVKARVSEELSGLDFDFEERARQAKDAAEQLAMAALLKAQEAGIDIQAIALQVQSKGAELAAEVQDQAANLSAELRQRGSELYDVVQEGQAASSSSASAAPSNLA